MRTTIYKITFDDDTSFYSNSRDESIVAINKFHEDNDEWKPYNINTINGIIYGNNKKTRGLKSLERYMVKEYYGDYLDRYTDDLLEKAQLKNKTYSDHSIKRFQNSFLSFINDLELRSRNSGVSDEVIHERILACGLFTH